MASIGRDSAKRAAKEARGNPCALSGERTRVFHWEGPSDGIVSQGASLGSSLSLLPHPQSPTKPTPILHALFHCFTARWHYLGRIGGQHWRECCICRKQEVLPWGDPNSPF